MRDTIIRAMRPEEAPLLADFLYDAIYVPPGQQAPPRDIMLAPELRVYVDGFGGGAADTCVVAVRGERVVGAAWARIMADYGHIDDDTPSLAMSVQADCRGQGIGTALLNALRARGYRRASLSVQRANAAARLYRRLGFEVVESRAEDDLMVITLT